MTNLKSDLKLLISLVVWMLIPSIYLLVRMNIVSVNNVDINILGQMEWFDLIDEVITTMLIIPLYSILTKNYSKYKNGTAMLMWVIIYLGVRVVRVMQMSVKSVEIDAEYTKE